MSGPNLQAHLHDPNWPIGYPYSCALDYVDRRLHYSAPPVLLPGTRGKVIGRSEENNNPRWVYITTPFELTPRTLWVPFNHLQIGTDYRYNEIHVYIVDPTIRQSQVLNQGYNTKDQLRRALEQLALAFSDNVEICWWLPPWFTDRIRNEQTRNNLINSIYIGMVDSVRQVLNRPNFTIRDLINALKPVGPRDDKAAVYTRIYWEFQELNRDPSQYIGKSVNPGSRDLSHNDIEDAEKHSNHYKIARASKRRIMGIICYAPEAHVRTAAEQFFVLLFQCYSPAVLNYQPSAPSSNPDSTTPQVASGNNDQAASNVARFSADKEQARVMQMIADKSFEASGWPGGRSRPQYRAGNGCNWKSPITEMFTRESTIWTKQSYVQQNLDIYRRPPVQVNAKKGYGDSITHVIYIVMELKSDSSLASESRGKFVPTIPQSMGLKPGQWVYPVIEMTRDGSHHHLNWSRLPTIGPWDDWNNVLSWAIKIEWQDDYETWHSAYIRASRVFDQRRPPKNQPGYNEPGAHNTYAQGIAVYRYLKQLTLTQNGRPAWLYDYGVARLKEQYVNFLEQTLRVKNVLPSSFNTVQHVLKAHPSRLVSLYIGIGLNAGVPFGLINWPSQRPRYPPQSCDTCYLMRVESREILPNGQTREIRDRKTATCERVELWYHGSRCDFDICKTCAELGRVCTWTVGIETCPLDDRRVLALLPPPIDSNIAYDMPDPQLTRALDFYDKT